MSGPSNLQANAAFIIEIGCTSKVLERFKNDRIIVKTGLSLPYLQKGLSGIKVKWTPKIRTEYWAVTGCNQVLSVS